LVFMMEEGVPLPSEKKWKVFVNDKKVRITAADGFYSTGKNGVLLAAADEAALEAYPQIKNVAFITVMSFDYDNKTTHYTVVEARWPGESL